MLQKMFQHNSKGLCLLNQQLTEDGRPGQSGPCVTAAVAVVTRNARAAAPTPPRSMVAPSVKVKASRSWPVIPSAQVTRITGEICGNGALQTFDKALCMHTSLHLYMCFSLTCLGIAPPLTHPCDPHFSSSHLQRHPLNPRPSLSVVW